MDLDEIRVVITGDASGLSRTIGQVESELGRLAGAESSAGAAGQRAARQTENGWQKAGKGLKEFGKSIDDIAKPIYVTSAAFAAGGVAAAKFAIDFEDNFAAVKKTVDGTPEQLDAIKQSIIDMTTVGINGHSAIPLTTAELNELAAAGGQLGIQTENIADFTETMAMLGTATNLVGEQGAATLARFMNVTNTSQDKISNLGSAIVDLGNNFATTEAEIAQMALNMGATGNVVGISAQDVLAYSTALSSLGVEAQAGGSSVARIWMDIQSAVSSGGKDLQKFAKLSGKSSKDFADQWKNDASGAFQAFLKGLSESEDQIGALSDLGFNNIRDIQALQRLAGEKGLGLLTEAIKRANSAWSENTALQTEFDAKAETTASQIQVMKNNLVEAARGFGELLLPTLKNVTGGIAGFAKGLASLDDGAKQNIIGIGAAFIGLGAAVKGTTGIIKGIGGFVSAIGDIKAAFSAGGALASLGSIASVAGPAALAIGGLTAAILVGKAAYDNWYDSQYRWTKGLSEGNEKVKESLDKYKNLSSIQKEVNDLQWVIKNPESSTADVENAKSRLEEIKSLLSEEYNLVINSDNSNLDETLEKVKQISAKELQSKINSQNVRLGELQNKNQNYEADRKEAEKNYNQALDFQTKASDAKLRLEDIYRQVKDGTLEQAQAYKQAKEIYKDTMGYEYRAINEGADNLTGLLYSTNGISQAFVDASNKVKYYSDAIKNLDGSHAEMVAVGTELANWQTELVGLNAAAHDNAGVMNNLHSMGDTIRKAGLDMSGYAQAASLAMNGLTDFNGAIEKIANGDGADLSAVIRDYSTAMDAFGATAEQKQAGLQAFADKLTEIGHATNTLPADKHIEITADGNAVVVAGEARQSVESVPEEHNTEIKAEDNTAAGVQSAKSNLSTIPRNIPVTISVHQTIGDGSSLFNKLPNAWSRQATGTDYFSGGLAMVNDQRGVADPRELIVDKGRAFIPEGRDVILPLSKGAKVYTAAETKRILAGIPHYAGGKDNSDAFTSARDDWQHYTRTHALTTAQELEKWLEFQQKYKENEKDIWDIEEQVFSLRQKQYSEQTRASEQWLAHETKYNGLAYSEQLDAIDRIRQNTVAAYEAGIISHKEYLDTIAKYDEEYLDTRKEQIAEMFDVSKAYISEHTYLNDWADNGDDPIEAYNRVKRDRLNELNAKELTQKEYDEYMKSLGSDMFQGRLEQSYGWLDEQSKYFDLSDEDYIKGLQRMQEYTQKYLDKGIIGRVEYHKAMTELNHQIWDKQEEILNEGLEKQREEIDKIKQQFQDEEQTLRDSWAVDDRRESIADLTEKVRLWQGAVTERGQEQLKQYQEQLKQAQREEELYQLQVKNNATIEEMEKQYKLAEDNKKVLLRGIRSEVVDAQEAVNTLVDSVENNNSNLETLLGRIEKAIYSIETGNTTNYNDNRKQTTINNTRSPGVGEIAHGYFPYAVSR